MSFDQKYEILKLDPKELDVDAYKGRYQRLLDKGHVKRMKVLSGGFNHLVSNVVTASKRDGVIRPIDGQHRVKLAIENDVKEIDVKLIYGLSAKEEGKLFDIMNSTQKSSSVADRLISRVDYGDKDAIEIFDDIIKCGLSPRKDINPNFGILKSVSDFMRLRETYGRDYVMRAASTLADAWPRREVSGKILVGLTVLISKNPKFYTTEKLNQSLRSLSNKIYIGKGNQPVKTYRLPGDLIKGVNDQGATRGEAAAEALKKLI